MTLMVICYAPAERSRPYHPVGLLPGYRSVFTASDVRAFFWSMQCGPNVAITVWYCGSNDMYNSIVHTPPSVVPVGVSREACRCGAAELCRMAEASQITDTLSMEGSSESESNSDPVHKTLKISSGSIADVFPE